VPAHHDRVGRVVRYPRRRLSFAHRNSSSRNFPEPLSSLGSRPLSSWSADATVLDKIMEDRFTY
jgi:hypothetical protein